MIQYGKVKSSLQPQQVEMTSDYVFISSNITSSEETIDNQTYTIYEYDYTRYTKDEYIRYIAATNEELAEELEATKILLGVE